MPDDVAYLERNLDTLAVEKTLTIGLKPSLVLISPCRNPNEKLALLDLRFLSIESEKLDSFTTSDAIHCKENLASTQTL